jgi:type I restriction enzyme, R subunit
MDEDMKDIMRNNPADVVYGAFSRAFLQGMIRMFQSDRDMQNIVMTDMVAREQATRHFFKRAQGMVWRSRRTLVTAMSIIGAVLRSEYRAPIQFD